MGSAMSLPNGRRPAPIPHDRSRMSIQASMRRVIIVGGGFGGLSAARALRGAAVRVTLSLIMLQFRVSPQEV